jgi:hypothetical protein
MPKKIQVLSLKEALTPEMNKAMADLEAQFRQHGHVCGEWVMYIDDGYWVMTCERCGGGNAIDGDLNLLGPEIQDCDGSDSA